MSQNILIIGATSAIAQCVAKIYATNHANLVLVARNETHLKTVANDLTAHGATKVNTLTWDANTEESSQLINKIKQFFTQIDITLIAYGSLPNQDQCQNNAGKALEAIRINGTSVIALLTDLANLKASQQQGTIAVISSVAGDRGRQSNYVYGCAKALLNTFLQGLRARLYKSNVHVLTIKPGFVDTPMTAHLKKSALYAKPEKVACDIVTAIKKKKNIIYTPKFWSLIMLIIKLLPEKIAKRLSF